MERQDCGHIGEKFLYEEMLLCQGCYRRATGDNGHSLVRNGKINFNI